MTLPPDPDRLRRFYESRWTNTDSALFEKLRKETRAYAQGEIDAALSSGGRFLEIGPGTGAELRRLTAAGRRGFGVDISLPLLRTYAPAIPACQGDAVRLPFRAGTFHAVFADSILMHLDLSAAVSEMRRILAPDGVVIIAEPLSGNPWMKIWRAIDPTYRGLARWHSLVSIEETLRRNFHSWKRELAYLNPPLALLPRPFRGVIDLERRALALCPSLAWMAVFTARKGT